ncbi:MAG: DUF6529 family protein [Actinomycetota bacterium]
MNQTTDQNATDPGDIETSDPAAAGAPSAGTSARMQSPWPLVTAAAIGAAVSISLGVYGRLHEPTRESITTFGFPAVLPMKAWLTTGAATLALLQGLSALWMWGRLPRLGPAPAMIATAHRWTGTVAFLLTLPVAYHCLWSLGFQDTTTRVLAHSLLGCAFYGAFVTKMLVLRSDRMPARALPSMGALLVVLLVAIWWTSSWWFFTTFGVPGF